MSTDDAIEAKVKDLGRALITATRAADDGAYKTSEMRHAADLMIDLREFFTNTDGLTDYRGRSWAYRSTVNEALDYAGLTGDERAKVMSALRYHVSNLLRERLTPEQLSEYGMIAATSVERQRESRKVRARMARIAARGERISDVGEAEDALRVANTLLRNIEPRTARSKKLDSLYASITEALTERK